MGMNQKLILSKEEILSNKLEDSLLRNHKKFNLTQRETEIFWLIFNQIE